MTLPREARASANLDGKTRCLPVAQAVLFWEGSNWHVSREGVEIEGSHPTLDLAIRAAHGAGLEVVAVTATRGGIKRVEKEKRA